MRRHRWHQQKWSNFYIIFNLSFIWHYYFISFPLYFASSKLWGLYFRSRFIEIILLLKVIKERYLSNSDIQNRVCKFSSKDPFWLRKINKKSKKSLTLFSVGYFLRTESVGGGHICPPSVFLKKISGAPFKFKIFAIFLLA